MPEEDLLDEDLNFYRQCGIDDAQLYIRGLFISGSFPSDLDIESVNQASDTFFEKSYGMNGEYMLANLGGNVLDFHKCKEVYKKAFIRKAILYFKELKANSLEDSKNLKKKKEEFAIEGNAEAAKWFVAIQSASFLRDVTESDIERVAKIAFNYLHDTEENVELKTSFLASFIKEAKLLFSSIKDKK